MGWLTTSTSAWEQYKHSYASVTGVTGDEIHTVTTDLNDSISIASSKWIHQSLSLFAQQLTMNGSKWLRKTGSNAIQSSRNSRFFCPFFNPSISICHPSPGFFNQHLLKLRQKHWGWQILKVVHGIQGRERCGDFPRLLLSQQNQKGGPFWIFGDNLDGFFLDNLDGYSMVILWLFIIIIHLDGYFWGKNYG